MKYKILWTVGDALHEQANTHHSCLPSSLERHVQDVTIPFNKWAVMIGKIPNEMMSWITLYD